MSQRTQWKDAEWNDFALMLDEMFPDQAFMQSPDLLHITARHLNAAGALMTRPRHFVALATARDKLLEAFARLRAQGAQGAAADSGKQQESAATATAANTSMPDEGHRFHRAPPPAEPPSPLKLGPNGEVPRERVAKPELDGTAADKLFEAVAWTREEWLAIATEIHRANPVANYPQRGNVAGLDTEDVALAQHVLPPERQIRHLKVVSFSQLRPQLLEAFGDLKKLHDLAKAALPKPTAAPVPKSWGMMPAVPEARPAPVAAPGPVNPYEAAFAPLVDLLLDRLVDRLRPVLAELVGQQQPARAQPIQVAAAPARAADDKPRKMHIGVIGNRNTYQDELEREFPHLRITCIDTHREVDSLKACDKIFVMTKFVKHTTMGKLKHDKTLNAIYTMVNGGLTDLRRVIGGVFPPPPPPDHAPVRMVH